MKRDYSEVIFLISNLSAVEPYYGRDNIFWYENNPSILFIIEPSGNISIKNSFTDQKLSIYELWNDFDKSQKKLIAFNIDKFR